MIKVYSSKFSPKPTETHEITAPTVGAWLEQNIKSYRRDAPVPMSVMIDGVLVPQMHWHDKLIDKSCDVRIVVEPKGTELFFGALFVVATRAMSPAIPKVNAATPTQGKDIDSPAAKGNKIKVNDTRTEVAGQFKIYGNYLKEPRRYFKGDRDMRVDMCLDMGNGHVHFDPTDLYIGDTPISSYGDSADWKLYLPGESLAADPRSWWWHDVKEVGSGSNGASGLELTMAKQITPSYQAESHTLSGMNISIPVGSGSFPPDWEAGIIIRLEAAYTYDVIDSSAGDIIRGMAVRMLAPVVGQKVEIASGVNAGYYTVRTYTPYSPAVPANPGAPTTITGSNVPSTFDFSTSPETFTYRVNSVNYPVTINTNTTNLAGLVSAINAAKPSGAPFDAVAQAGLVRLVDNVTPYTGRAATLTGGSRIFGSSPVNVQGTAATAEVPEVIPEITLSLPDGTAARSLVSGSQRMTIGPRDLRWRVITATTQNLSVQRLDENGATDTTFPGFDPIDTPDAIATLDPSNLEGGFRGPFAAVPPNAKTEYLEWDVFFPRGLFGMGKKGQRYQIGSKHYFEWRDADLAGPWNREERNISGSSIDSIGRTFRIKLPYPMRAEVRIAKGREGSEQQTDDIVWYGCRARIAGNATRYNNSTVLCLTVRGGDYLSSKSEAEVWGRGTRVLPSRELGAWTAPRPTRSIVDYCLNVLKAAGYKDSDFDLEEWDRLNDHWNARGDTFDWVFKEQLTVEQVVNKALAVGFAELTVKHGLLSPVQDVAQDVFQDLYTCDSMVEPLSIQFETPSGDDFDGIDARFMDPSIWQIQTVQCRIPGAPAAKRVKVVDYDGVSSRDVAYRLGMRELMTIKHQRKSCKWSTEMHAFNSYYLDFVQVAGETPGYAQSVIMEAATNGLKTIRVDQKINFDDFTPPYFVSVKRLDGKCFGPVKATKVDEYTVLLEKPLDFTPEINVQGVEPPYVLIGQGYPVKITSIEPDGTDEVACTGKVYAPIIHTYDNATAP